MEKRDTTHYFRSSEGFGISYPRMKTGNLVPWVGEEREKRKVTFHTCHIVHTRLAKLFLIAVRQPVKPVVLHTRTHVILVWQGTTAWFDCSGEVGPCQHRRSFARCRHPVLARPGDVLSPPPLQVYRNWFCLTLCYMFGGVGSTTSARHAARFSHFVRRLPSRLPAL